MRIPPAEHHCSHHTESWTYHGIRGNESGKNKKSETQGKKLKQKSLSKDSHDQIQWPATTCTSAAGHGSKESSPAMQWHYIQSFAVILAQKFCKHDFCRWIPLTGSTLLSSALRQKLFFFKVHIFVTHPHKHFSRSITKKCHRHVHRPPATILHSTTNCAIGSQSFLLQISFSANFEGKMLLSKRRWTRCTLWTRFSEPPTRRKGRKKGSQNVHPAPKMRAKIKKKKKTQTCVAVVALIASKKARTPSSSSLAAGFSIAVAHPALCFFPPPFTVVKETWQPVLPVYTSQKQAKKAHVVLRTLAFKHACSLMSCSTPACSSCM